ncbi:MAG: hypothetical protein RL417_2028, partial [Pseudomonadota bacterium]
MSTSFKIELIEELFPFCFELSGDLHLARVAPKLAAVCPECTVGVPLKRAFRLSRPMVEPSFQAIVSHSRDIFVLDSIEHPGLTLRGQFVTHEGEAGEPILLFIGGPWITRLAQLGELGLEINDFPPHDPRGDFLVLLQTQWTNLEDMRALTEQLRSTAQALEAKSLAMKDEMERRSALEMQLRQSQKMEALGRL